MPQIPDPRNEDAKRREEEYIRKASAELEESARLRQLDIERRQRGIKANEEVQARLAAAEPLGPRPVIPVMGQDLGGGMAERRTIPDINDPIRDAPEVGKSVWTSDLARPAAPEGDGPLGMGSGGPLNPVKADTPFTEADVIDIRSRYEERKAAQQAAADAGRLLQGVDPDKTAQALDLAERAGVPPLVAQNDPSGVERALRLSELRRQRTESPRLSEWLIVNPSNFDIAHDDTENLGWWEYVSRPVGALASGVVDASMQAGANAIQWGINAVNAEVIARDPEVAEAGKIFTGAADALGAEARKAGAAVGEYLAPRTGDATFDSVLDGTRSLGNTAVWIGAAVIKRDPSIAMAGMSATTAVNEYGRARDEGLDHTAAARFGSYQGLIEGATEMLPMKWLVGDIVAKTPIGETILRQLGAEIPSEQLATLLQDAVDWAELNPDKTLGEFIAERPDAAYRTFIATAVGTAAQTGIAKATDAGAEKLDQNYQQKRAEEIANMIRAMGDKAADSKLLKRMPEKYREAVTAITKDGPLENIRVDGEAFSELAQEKGLTVERLAQAFRIDAAEALTAIEAGQDVVIPSGNYAAVIQTAKKEIGIGGAEIHTAFAPNIRLRADDFTAKEVEAMKKIVSDEQAARAASEGENSFADSADRVREDSRQRLAATGRFNAETTAIQSSIPAEFIITLAERTGQDPEALWKDFAARAESKLQTEEGELAQSGERAPIEADDDMVVRASEAMSEYSFAVWKAAAIEARTNQQIADDPEIAALRASLPADERDMMPGAESISIVLAKARALGFPVGQAQRGPRSNKDTLRKLVKLGLSTKDIHTRLGLPPEKRASLNVQVSKIKKEMREAGELPQEQRGGFTGMNLSQEAVIRLYESANLSTFVHETAHWYLTTLEKMGRMPDAHPFVIEQLASIRNWAGKHPEFEIYDEAGQITPEGVEVQEMFAETFEAYLREGKAPSSAMRSVFAAFKSWLMRVYKSIAEIGGRVRLDAEITAVFDRALATDEAIAAARKGMDKNAEAMAKAMLDKGVITQRQYERTKERLLAAREKAEADLMARLMEQYERNQKVWWREEERDVRRDVQSEIDERPEQRAYQVFTGEGWRDTLEDHIEAAIREAELAQGRFDLDTREARAEWVAENTVDDVIPGEATDSRQYGFALSNGTNIVVQLIPQLNGETEIHWTFLSRLKDRADETGVYAKGQESFTADDVLEMMPRIAAIVETDMAKMGRDGYSFTSVRRSVRNMNARLVRLLEGTDYEIVEFPGQDDPLLIHRDADVAENGKILPRPENRGRKFEWDGTEDPEGYADAFYEKVSALEPGGPAGRSDRGRSGSQDGREAELVDAGAQGELGQERSRQLDAMGFYSAAQEAATRVPDNIWKLGWQAARNALAKGQDGIVPRKTEIEFLGLDGMFGGTKLRGEELKAAVLEHIAAKRLLLSENFARFDPNAKAPAKAVMLDQIDDDTLAFMLGVGEVSIGGDEGRVIASELDGANEFNTGLFVQINKQLSDTRADDAIKTRQEALDYMFSLSMGYPREQWDAEVGAAFEFVSDERVIDQARNKWAGRHNSERRRYYDLYRVMDGGNRELVDTGVIGDLTGVAGRIIVNENRNLVLRKIGAETMQEYWRESRNEERTGIVRSAGDIRLPGEDVPLFESVIGLPEGVPGSDYQAPRSHVGGKAKGTLVTAHGEERVDDKGQRTLFTGQVQSDMAQQAREQKEIDRQNAPIIEASGITDRKSALDFLFTLSPGFKREEWDAEFTDESDQRLIDRARMKWADRNGMQYGGSGWSGDALSTDAPLLSTSEWTNVAVRAMVYRAARDGFASVSFPTAETSEIIQGNDDAAQHYETNVKGALEKIGKQLGGAVRTGAVEYPADARFMVQDSQGAEYNTFGTERAAINAAHNNRRFKDVVEVDGGKAKASAYILDITPEMRAKIVAEGFPLFHTGTRKGRVASPPSVPPMRLDLRAVEEQYGPEALAALPPKVRAHSASATDADQFVALARDVQATLKKKAPRSLWKFLSNKRTIGEGNDKITYSGIRDPDGEILAMIGKRNEARGLIATPENDSKKSRSYSIEEAIQAAYDKRYFRGDSLPTIAEFLDILRADIDGTAKLYQADEIPLLQQIEDAEANAAWFDQMEIDITEENDAALRAAIEVKLSGQGTNAIGPDEAAERLSAALKTNAFPDGNALLQALKEGPKRDKLIREETKRRMIERHGDIFNDGTIMQAAAEAARNEIQYRQDEIELEALAAAAGQQAAKNLARETAKELLRDKQVREVLNYNQWLLLEQRWMKKAVEAAEKGKTDKALEYKRYAMINGAMFKEASKLAEKIEKTRKHLLDYTSRTKRSRLLEAGRDYLDQMTGLLDDYQFRPESKKGEAKRASRAVWLQTQMVGLDPFAAYADPTKSAQEQMAAAAEAIERSAMLARLADGVDAKNYKSITVEELLAVRDEADLIYRLATLKDRLIKEGERRRLSLAAGDIVASVSANQPKARPPEPMESNLPGEKFKRAVSGFMVSHRTFQALARQFDGGKEGGVFWRYIVRPLNDAFARKTTLMKQAGKDVEKLFSVFEPSELARFMRDRQTISLVAEDGTTEKVSLTTQGRIAVALNAGNEKNLARLMDSNGWDRKQVQAILDTLSKKEMDFVQATWDYLETWFAEADRVHQSVHGVPMDKQEPKQLATRHGVYAGGYFPIAFDPHRSSKAGQRKLEQDAQAAGGGRVGVRQEAGFAKKRVSGKVTLPLNLDPFAVILRHLDQVTTSIATEEVLFDVGRLIKRPEVEQIIVERHGRVKYDEIIESVKAAKFGLPVAQGSVEKVLNHVRNGSTVAKLGWSVSTAMLQPSGISNSIVRIGFPWMMRGYARMLGGAAQMEGWAKWAMERSEFMRNRRENQSPEQVNLLATLKGNKPLVMVQRSAFQLMAQVQFFSVDLATWYGAFDKAVAGGADEALAVSMADQAVLDAQGGGEAFQTAGIQRGSVGVRLLTNLMSYMLTTYQLSVQSFANKDPNIIAKIARISADMVLLWSVPVAATMAIRYAIQAAISGDDDDEEYWSLENISREQGSFLMSPYFGLSQIAGAVKTDPYTYRGPAGLDMLVQTYKATEAASHGDVEELLRPLNQMAGMAFHLPANQIDKSVRGSIALWEGETDSLLALFFGPPPK